MTSVAMPLLRSRRNVASGEVATNPDIWVGKADGADRGRFV
jgi:hypothetical protein